MTVQTLTRVRHTSGALGWHNSTGEILMDEDRSLKLMSFWRPNSKEDQEDFGVPPAGYYTAYGYWLPVEPE